MYQQHRQGRLLHQRHYYQGCRSHLLFLGYQLSRQRHQYQLRRYYQGYQSYQ